MFAPIVVVIVLSFNPKQFGIFPMEGVSFRWFIKLAQNESIIEAFKNSLVLGSLTAVISTGIGILAALAFIRFEFPGKNTLNTLLLSPIMIPEVVLGVALLLFLRWLQQPKSFALLLIGHVVLTLPYVLLIVQARLVGIKKNTRRRPNRWGPMPFRPSGRSRFRCCCRPFWPAPCFLSPFPSMTSPRPSSGPRPRTRPCRSRSSACCAIPSARKSMPWGPS
jgi:spermidine/putrescine transport system permease protein